MFINKPLFTSELAWTGQWANVWDPRTWACLGEPASCLGKVQLANALPGKVQITHLVIADTPTAAARSLQQQGGITWSPQNRGNQGCITARRSMSSAILLFTCKTHCVSFTPQKGLHSENDFLHKTNGFCVIQKNFRGQYYKDSVGNWRGF